MNEILHHFDSRGHHLLLAFTRIISFQGSLGGAGIRSSVACFRGPPQNGTTVIRLVPKTLQERVSSKPDCPTSPRIFLYISGLRRSMRIDRICPFGFSRVILEVPKRPHCHASARRRGYPLICPVAPKI